MIKELDKEIYELSCERSRRRRHIGGTGHPILNSKSTYRVVETTRQEAPEDGLRDEKDDNDFNPEGKWGDERTVHLDGKHIDPKESPLKNTVASNSDSHSGHGCSTESVSSLKSGESSFGIPLNILQKFIAVFGSTLIHKSGAWHWAKYTLAHYHCAEVEKRLTVLLGGFKPKLEDTGESCNSAQPDNARRSLERLAGAARLVRHNAAQIARYFYENMLSAPFSPSVNTTTPENLLQQLDEHFSLHDRLPGLTRNQSTNSDQTESVPDEQPDTELFDSAIEENTLVKLESLLDTLLPCNEFHLLALNVRRQLYHDDELEMKGIEHILSSIPLQEKESGIFKADFTLHWSAREYVCSQYGEKVPHLGSVVVITGSTLYAQATTCAEYIKSTWPKSGHLFVELLESLTEALKSQREKRVALFSTSSRYGLPVQAVLYDSKIIFAAQAITEQSLVEFAQQLAWLGSVLRISPFGEQSAYFKPLFLRSGPRFFEIKFKHASIHGTEYACWLPLFCGAAIAAGFPIPERGDEIGLEVPLALLAGLAGVRHAVEYDNGVVMKGFSHMFVPVRRINDRLQWHAISSLDTENRLSYQDGLSRCGSRATLQEVGLRDLESLRNFVGWCSVVESRLGSHSANYSNIDYSKAEDADSGTRCTGGSLGFQQFGLATLDFRFGVKDGRCHFQRRGPFQKIIQVAENTPIVLHDTGEKRAWLVPASEVMLHIIQHRHHLNPFTVDGKQIRLKTSLSATTCARTVLLENRAQRLLDDEDHTYRDEILDIWSMLEFLLDQNVSRYRSESGAALEGMLREVLYGFEYKAVVLERSPLRLKKMNISKTNGGWPLLVREIDALVLFADGFEDLIVPAEQGNERLCRRWKRVPKERDYLATRTKMLLQLYDEAGSRLDRKYLTSSSKLQWHQGSSILFDACQMTGRCQCDRLQQLFPKSTVGTIVPPPHVVDDGAVIFGRSDLTLATMFPRGVAGRRRIFSQPNIPLEPILVNDDHDGSDDTERSNSGSILSQSTTMTLDLVPEICEEEMKDAPGLSTAKPMQEALQVQCQREKSRTCSSIDESMDSIRGLDQEIYELSC
ncbi:Nn.00g028660.m01.CDS01 [Neocucurbitaria sp. VM-36]